MTLFLLNLLLALIWVLLWGSANIFTIVTGLLGGYFVLWIFTRVHGRHVLRRAYGGRVFDTLRFTGYFLALLVRSNITLAKDILTPTWYMRPRIIRYDVSHLSDPQIVVFSNALTLTPGTLTVDISDDKRFLYVHCMYAQDRQQVVRELDLLRMRMEREVFRIVPVAPQARRRADPEAFEQDEMTTKSRNTPPSF